MRRVAVAAQLKSSMATALERAHSHTLLHSHTHGYHAASHASLSSSSLFSPLFPLLSSIMPKCSYLRNERRIALHRIACPFFVLRLTFACWLTGYGYGYAFERFKFHIATALPPSPLPALRISATLSELNNLSQVFLSKMATCNYVDTPSTHCNHKFIKKHTHTHAHRKIPSHFGLSSTSFRPDFICFPLGHLKVRIVLCALLKVNPFCNMFCFSGLSWWSDLCDISLQFKRIVVKSALPLLYFAWHMHIVSIKRTPSEVVRQTLGKIRE